MAIFYIHALPEIFDGPTKPKLITGECPDTDTAIGYMLSQLPSGERYYIDVYDSDGNHITGGCYSNESPDDLIPFNRN